MIEKVLTKMEMSTDDLDDPQMAYVKVMHGQSLASKMGGFMGGSGSGSV